MKDLRTPAVKLLEIGEEAAGQRIDNFLLRTARGVPKSHLYRIIRSGEVRVNRRRIAAAYKLKSGDVVRLPPLRQTDVAKAAGVPPREFPVVWEDAALLVIDKPAGVAVHGGSGVAFGVIEQLRAQRTETRLLELAHRLDRETSGLLIIAQKRTALTQLHDLFRQGGVTKRYLALVKGNFRNTLQHVRLPLIKSVDVAGERHVRVARPSFAQDEEQSKSAHSIVRRVAGVGEFTLVEVELKTGRTHQIRVHLAHLGHPILGDDKYGDFALNRTLQKRGLARMFLHAAHLQLKHPLSGEELKLESVLPDALKAFIESFDGVGKK